MSCSRGYGTHNTTLSWRRWTVCDCFLNVYNVRQVLFMNLIVVRSSILVPHNLECRANPEGQNVLLWWSYKWQTCKTCSSVCSSCPQVHSSDTTMVMDFTLASGTAEMATPKI
ncbi:hypothetical protein BsWGS_11353 [Bradybaena similaris]